MPFVVPAGVDDIRRPSGGNTYDLELVRNLPYADCEVELLPVAGRWPRPGEIDRQRLAALLAGLPDRSAVLLDGLVACSVPDLVEREADRLRLVVIVHMPLADERGLDPQVARELHAGEQRVLHHAAAAVAVSAHTARRLVSEHQVSPGKVYVAEPGANIAEPARGTDGATQLLSVASLTPVKGHEVLVAALAQLADLPWRLRLVGGIEQAPGHVAYLRHLITAHRLADRISIDGPLTGDALNDAYDSADLLLLASHAESYGLVLTEALARGIPALASRVGGIPDAMGNANGAVPGMLLPASEPTVWAGALRTWLTDPDVRDRSREAARRRRMNLLLWHHTAHAISSILQGAPAAGTTQWRRPLQPLTLQLPVSWAGIPENAPPGAPVMTTRTRPTWGSGWPRS
ncbi:glycosyltransferase [Streptomyces sp. Ju416(a)]|uniref:glycosyltransferase n=1 Tax=Streptomyces sp. Ju416(a) TaxID=3446591 RepID=UPI00403D7F84